MPKGKARFGPKIFGMTNATPCVISVDNTFEISENERIRVAGLVDDQSAPTLNGDYTIESFTNNSITLYDDTSSKAVYISGGFVSALELDNPVEPNPPFNIVNRVPQWWNQASQI